MGIRQWTVGKSAPELTENVCTQGTGTHFSAPNTRSRLSTWAPAPCPYFGVGPLRKRCVHISAHQESYLGSVLGHQV